MSFQRKTYDEIVQNVLDYITRGVVSERHMYTSSQQAYTMELQPVRDIDNVEGIVNNALHTFEKGVDYVLASNYDMDSDSNIGSLEWIGAAHPDEGTEFKVSYLYSLPSGLTDVNAGSVLRTMVEAISRELEGVYSQIDRVYRSGFIDTAVGEGLDLVASIVGVKRKPPTRAMGLVTFWRKSSPPENQVNGEVILYDGRDNYQLKNRQIKSIASVSGLVNNGQQVFAEGRDYQLDADRNSVLWLGSSNSIRPDKNSAFTVDYIVFEEILIPKGTFVSNVTPQPSDARIFETVEDAKLLKAINGRWQCDVQVRARAPGKQGNVAAGTIRLMPKPPIGVELVVNNANLAGGTDTEDDFSLRNRAKRAIEVTGRATIDSLKSALEGVEGIQSSPLIRENPDGIPGLVKVVIDGGEDSEIQRIIRDTRAAGIRVEYKRPDVVSLDFYITAIVGPKNQILNGNNRLLRPASTSSSPSPAAQSTNPTEYARNQIPVIVKDFVSSLRVGDGLVYNQLLSAVLSIQGVLDVKDVNIDVFKGGSKVSGGLKSNIETSEDERLYPRSIEVSVQEQEDSLTTINDKMNRFMGTLKIDLG